MASARQKIGLNLGGHVDVRKLIRQEMINKQNGFYIEQVRKRDEVEKGFFVELIQENRKLHREMEARGTQILYTGSVEEGKEDLVAELEQSII